MAPERRNSYPFDRKWKALFGFLGFSGFVTVAMLIFGGGRALEQIDAIKMQLTVMQRQHANEYAAQAKLNGEFRGRIAELTTSENQMRELLKLPPLVHQTILDGEPVAYILPRKPEIHHDNKTAGHNAVELVRQ